MSKHALLSASSSERWMNCSPSARLCENYEDKGSNYAAEGTAAHELCEYKLKSALGIKSKDPTADLTYYDSEMEECATGYAEHILELLAVVKETCPDPVGADRTACGLLEICPRWFRHLRLHHCCRW